MHVNPGDLVFADNDAIVIVPRTQAEEVYQRTVEREALEDNSFQEVLKDGSWTF